MTLSTHSHVFKEKPRRCKATLEKRRRQRMGQQSTQPVSLCSTIATKPTMTAYIPTSHPPHQRLNSFDKHLSASRYKGLDKTWGKLITFSVVETHCSPHQRSQHQRKTEIGMSPRCLGGHIHLDLSRCHAYVSSMFPVVPVHF